jgi:lysophospholipid acyltransferase (LPLAT)-like uncharacterized protein
MKRRFQKALDWVFATILPPMLIGLMRLLYSTLRWEVHGRENLAPFWDEHRQVIIGFWHGRLLLMPPQWERKGNAHVLIGKNRNGELITRMIAPWGIGAIRGGHRGGGAQARQEMMEAYFRGGGQTLAFTPDGPQGPRYSSKIGMAQLSRDLDVPVVWLSGAASKAIHMPLWDRFVIPLPFSKVTITWSPPIHPALYASAALEEYRDALDAWGRAYQRDVDERARNVDPRDETLLRERLVDLDHPPVPAAAEPEPILAGAQLKQAVR